MTKRIYTIFGVILGVGVILLGLLREDQINENSILINDNILKNFYLTNRNLEDPIFIPYKDLSQKQINIIKEDYIKREVLKREALNWSLDKVDPIIASRLSQLGEQFLVNNLPDENITDLDLKSFYNENKHLYIDDAKITFSHIFFREGQDKLIENLNFYVETQNKDFFDKNLLDKVSAFPFQKNYAQRSESFIRGHFSEKTTREIFSLPKNDNWQGPIRSPYGFHLIKIASKSIAKQKTYGEVSDLVLKRYKNEKNKSDLKKQLEKKIKNYKIINN